MFVINFLKFTISMNKSMPGYETTTTSTSCRKKKEARSKLFGSSSSSLSFSTTATTLVLSCGGELANYLNNDKVSFNKDDDKDFDILQWWHDHKVTYVVLFILAQYVFITRLNDIIGELVQPNWKNTREKKPVSPWIWSAQ